MHKYRFSIIVLFTLTGLLYALYHNSEEGEMEIRPEYMIDDFEDGDIQVMRNQGRTGIWHLDNDGSSNAEQTPEGGFIPVKGGPEGSKYCAHTTGYGFTEWGAELNVNLNTPDTAGITEIIYMPYDASQFTGIVFDAKGACRVRVNFTTVPIVPTYYGGTCSNEKDCFDAHGKMFTLQHPDQWRRYVCSFSEIEQNGWGFQCQFDPAKILALQFHFPKGDTFDFSVDNVSFYK
jgi:hypothetical protein